jgi:diaminopimelate decarboxylase
MTDPLTDPALATTGSQFRYRNETLHCEGVEASALVEEFGTPLYVYSRAGMTERFGMLRAAFGDDAKICYAVKSNSNLSILKLFAELGAGFDLVSGGELRRLQAAGVSTDSAVFAGVAKADWEIEEALSAGIMVFNLESEHELPVLADLGRRAERDVRIAVRLNVDVDADTHDYISTGRRQDKFGLGLGRAAKVVEQIAATPGLQLSGYHVHLGSLLRRIDPYMEALDRVLEFMDGAQVRREGVQFYDCGGGYGVSYGDGEGILDVSALGAAMLPRLQERGLTPILEPGRFLVADAGILLTEVLGVKESFGARFVLVDAAMNDLLRPALYGATHPIATVREPGPDAEFVDCNIVGPVCESADFLAKNRPLPVVDRGDRLAVLATGAYGFSMASNYNTRRRPAEVLVDGERTTLIRRREDFADLWAQELNP